MPPAVSAVFAMTRGVSLLRAHDVRAARRVGAAMSAILEAA